MVCPFKQSWTQPQTVILSLSLLSLYFQRLRLFRSSTLEYAGYIRKRSSYLLISYFRYRSVRHALFVFRVPFWTLPLRYLILLQVPHVVLLLLGRHLRNARFCYHYLHDLLLTVSPFLFALDRLSCIYSVSTVSVSSFVCVRLNWVS